MKPIQQEKSLGPIIQSAMKWFLRGRLLPAPNKSRTIQDLLKLGLVLPIILLGSSFCLRNTYCYNIFYLSRMAEQPTSTFNLPFNQRHLIE